MENICFPFNHIVDDDEFLGAIGLCGDTESHVNADVMTDFDHLSFNLHRFENENYPSTDCTCDCRYYTHSQYNIAFSSDAFSIFHLNINSLNCHSEDLKNYLHNIDHNFSVLGISETYLKEKPSNCIQLHGFNFEYKIDLTPARVGMLCT